MNILLTLTGMTIPPPTIPHSSLSLRLGTKFVLLTSLVEPTADTVLQKVYEIYARR